MINEIIFSEKHEYSVELHGQNKKLLGSGTLKFGAGNFISVNISGFDSFPIPEGEPNIQAITASGDIFTLINCEIEDLTIYADLLISGEIELGVSSIIIRYADISEWFLHDQRIEGNVGESLNWSNAPPPIDATVQTDREQFKISSEVSSFIINNRVEERVLVEYVNFIFSKDKALFDFSEVREKPHHLACLFSILIAAPITITCIWVTGAKRNWLPTYFSAFERPKKEFERNRFWRNSLIRREMLDLHWPGILNSYFNSKHRESIWVRLAGMQRYQGFWEYKVLGYVSLLDSYATSITKLNNIKPTSNKLATIESIIQQIENLNTLVSSEGVAAIRAILNCALPKPRKELHFQEKYEYIILNTDANILKTINLSNEEFILLKKVRDTIAHGDAVDLEVYPHEKIFSITSKITLLLTFRALHEFGILAEDFMRSLYNTSNVLRYTKGLDITHLERFLNPTSFFAVSQDLFEKISKFKSERINACFTLSENGEIHYSEKYVTLFKKWNSTHPRENKSVVDFFGVEANLVTHIEKMRVEFDGQTKELIHAWLIRV
ncbi:hypothetical protein [Pseudomonas sp. B20]|uniref:hypothetical protein n=1 Tax=Pseudomonas sp. B20 TaxID=129268 RepID=UPI001CF9AD02|nr:hypothetical protein [Pseudomonas sp. B20]